MADPVTGPITHCPWCSAPLPDPAAERCPSCQAALAAVPDAPSDIKGVTTLDTEAILRARAEVARPRNRFLSFITGEAPSESGELTDANPDSLARPPDEVRREMLRLQLEAERADLVAEAVALKSDELARRGIHLSDLAEGEAADGGDEAAPGEPVEDSHDAAPGAPAEGSWPEELTPEGTEPGSPG